jgi:salicylate hydroxylase
MDERVDVAVIGAGIGGLTLALELRARGIAAEVFEQAPRLTTVGAAVALSANGNRVLNRLGIGDELAAGAAEPTELVYRHWHTSTRICSHRIGAQYHDVFGAGYYGVHRAVLLRLLANAVDPDHLHLDAHVDTVTEGRDGVRLTFADGRTVEAAVVVGADGAHSAIRSHVAPDSSLSYSGSSGFRGLVPREQLRDLPDPEAIQMWIGPGAHVVHYPCDPAGTVNFLAVVDEPAHWPSDRWRLDAPTNALPDSFAGWSADLLTMLTATPQSERWALFTQEPLRRWSRGRVVLLGDAAHTMAPHHGQGANVTIEDAAILASCLPDPRHHPSYQRYRDALRHYERIRRVRVRQIQRSSLDTAAVLHLPDGPAALRRDEELGSLPERFGWIHSYDVHAATANAVSPREAG